MKIESIFSQIENDIKNEYQKKGKILGSFPLELRSFIASISYIFHTIFKRLLRIEEGVFVYLARDDKMLEKHFNELGIKLKNGTKSNGKVEVEATSVVTVPKDFYFVYVVGNETYNYITTEEKVLSAGAKTEISIEAVLVGEKYNLDVGDLMDVKEPIVGLSNEVRVVSLSGGTDKERFLDAKQRVLDRKRAIGTSGTVENYLSWVKDVEGVLKGKVLSGVPTYGRLTVLFVLNAPSDFIPNSAKILEVKNYLMSKTVAGIEVIVLAPTTKVLDIRVSNVVFDSTIVADLATLSANVKKEIQRYLLDRAFDGNAITHSQITELIGGVAGETSHTLTINNSTNDIAIGERDVGVLGVFEFSA